MIRRLLDRLPIRVVRVATLAQLAADIAARDAKLEELRKRDFYVVDNLVTVEECLSGVHSLAINVESAWNLTKNIKRLMGVKDRSAVIPLRERGAYIPS